MFLTILTALLPACLAGASNTEYVSSIIPAGDGKIAVHLFSTKTLADARLSVDQKTDKILSYYGRAENTELVLNRELMTLRMFSDRFTTELLATSQGPGVFSIVEFARYPNSKFNATTQDDVFPGGVPPASQPPSNTCTQSIPANDEFKKIGLISFLNTCTTDTRTKLIGRITNSRLDEINRCYAHIYSNRQHELYEDSYLKDIQCSKAEKSSYSPSTGKIILGNDFQGLTTLVHELTHKIDDKFHKSLVCGDKSAKDLVEADTNSITNCCVNSREDDCKSFLNPDAELRAFLDEKGLLYQKDLLDKQAVSKLNIDTKNFLPGEIQYFTNQLKKRPEFVKKLLELEKSVPKTSDKDRDCEAIKASEAKLIKEITGNDACAIPGPIISSCTGGNFYEKVNGVDQRPITPGSVISLPLTIPHGADPLDDSTYTHNASGFVPSADSIRGVFNQAYDSIAGLTVGSGPVPAVDPRSQDNFNYNAINNPRLSNLKLVLNGDSTNGDSKSGIETNKYNLFAGLQFTRALAAADKPIVPARRLRKATMASGKSGVDAPNEASAPRVTSAGGAPGLGPTKLDAANPAASTPAKSDPSLEVVIQNINQALAGGKNADDVLQGMLPAISRVKAKVRLGNKEYNPDEKHPAGCFNLAGKVLTAVPCPNLGN